ncbi:hypothetical protein AC578_6181 [Pseudocercospora eumusae]|uniref:MYND-type domain-containing protein n=1 Tax=Pseudocercospora eumusae TaxID=321146 RepID=A0A139H9W6_9PEZI|nr:hypothetical protein AC578_6181 [Pseudocercospora eumusae]
MPMRAYHVYHGHLTSKISIAAFGPCSCPISTYATPSSSYTTPKAMPPSQQCNVCSKANIPLRACTRCRTTSYCSKDCQINDWSSHKSTCRRPNLLLKFHIYPETLLNPPVWRILSIPLTTNFADLHRALQIAFGWKSVHSYEFGVHDPDYEPIAGGDERVLQVMKKIQTLTKRVDDSRKYLLRIVDDAKYGTRRVGPEPSDRARKGAWEHPKTPEKNASEIKVFQVLDRTQSKGLQMSYTYDYGNRWEHEISVVGIAPATNVIQCVEGEGHGIAEDCGGIQGWQALLDAYKTSTPTKKQWEMRKWFEKQALNADPQGLLNGGDRKWDLGEVNSRLSRMV